MGFDTERFEGDLSEQFLCVVCQGVLEDPLQLTPCEHTFCRVCISPWVAEKSTCPIDRATVRNESLRPAARVLRNLLDDLRLACEFKSAGCNAVVKLSELEQHTKYCSFNPSGLVQCPAGCGFSVERNQLTGHNCVASLRESLGGQIDSLSGTVQKVSEQIERISQALVRFQMNISSGGSGSGSCGTSSSSTKSGTSVLSGGGLCAANQRLSGVQFLRPKIIVLGGQSGTLTNRTTLNSGEVYDTATDVWSHLPVAANSSRSSSPGPSSSSSTSQSGGVDGGMKDKRAEMATILTESSCLMTFGGFNGKGSMGAIESYDIIRREWSAYAPSMIGGKFGVGGVRVGSFIYLVGGYANGEVFSTMDRLDLTKKKWSRLQSMVTARRNPCALAWDNFIYVLGGYNGNTNFATVEKYSIATNRWSFVKSMSARRTHFAAALTPQDGRIWVFGGRDEKSLLKSAEVYDIARDTWKSLPDLPSKRQGATAVALGDVIYLMGGYDGNRILKTTLKYHIANGIWTSAAPMEAERIFHTSTLVYDFC